MQEIFEVAEKMFLKYGIKRISMDDLSRELGMSKKTLYQYFDNKADLVRKTLFHHIEQEKNVCDEVGNKAENALEEMLEITKYVSSQLESLSPSLLYDLQRYYRKIWDEFKVIHETMIYGIVHRNLSNGIEQGLYRSDINVEILSRMYVGKLEMIIEDDYFPSETFKKANVYKEQMKYHLYGITSLAGRNYLENHLLTNIELRNE